MLDLQKLKNLQAQKRKRWEITNFVKTIKMSTITLTELYSLLTEKVGKETAQSLTFISNLKLKKK